jgi:membrane fusion protein (multidrug efflux system)
MKFVQSQLLACGLVALAPVAGAGPLARAQSPPRAAQPVPANEARDAEVAVLKEEVAALRKEVETLRAKGGNPRPGQQGVVVAHPQAKDVVVTQQYAASIHARRHIAVRALERGAVSEVPVKEGQAVKKGDVLFNVSPALYQAKLDAALAEVKLTTVELERLKKLANSNAVSVAELARQEATLAKAQALVKIAQAELDFATVKAPFDGLVGRLAVQAGSAVKEGDDLTTLSDASVLWVYFYMPEARYLDFIADTIQMKAMSLELMLANGRKFPEAGKIGAIEAAFNNETGTVAFRADFPNPKGILRHGQSGVIVLKRTLKDALVIPQVATFEVLNRRFVYVVGKDGVAQQREVLIQHEIDGNFVVEEGLGVEDTIVVEGVRQVHAGEKLKSVLRKPDEANERSKHP